MLDQDIQALLDERKKTMLTFSSDYRPLNMYALLRKDLEMKPGKLASQAGHAFNMSYDKALIQRPEVTSLYKGSGNGTKICMYAKNLGQLIRAYRDCHDRGIPCELIIDRGDIKLPHFDGNPIITGLGIGPAYKDEMKDITKRYTMIE